MSAKSHGPRLAAILAATLIGAATASSASAASFGFTGAFALDNDKQAFSFTVGANGTVVKLRNWGYGGGTYAVDFLNGAAATSQTTASGGFDGLLALFDSSGALVSGGLNDSGPYNPLNFAAVPMEGGTGSPPVYYTIGDPQISLALDAGVYTLVLAQYGNIPTGTITDPFTYDGNPQYTVFGADGGLTTDPYDNRCTGGYFCDSIAYSSVSGTNWDGHWSVELANVVSASLVVAPPPSAVPAPAALPLLAGALGALALLLRRRS
jgi:hypothetical protein